MRQLTSSRPVQNFFGGKSFRPSVTVYALGATTRSQNLLQQRLTTMATAAAGNAGVATSCPEKDATPYERIVLEPPPDLEKEIEEAKGL